jgi:hypothetical protein
MDDLERRELERFRRVEKNRTEARELAEGLADFANHSGRDNSEEFIGQIIYKTHRTLQQAIFGLFVGLCEEWAKQDHPDLHDLRNEATVEGAKKVVEALKDHSLPFI